MASYCKVIVIGNLTKDPNIRYTPSGSAVAEVGIAVNRKWRTDDGEQKEEVSFFNVVAFGKTAELLCQYCKKGAPILFEGRLKQETWEDKQTRERKSAVKIIAEHMTFLGGNDRGDGDERSPDPQQQPRGKATSSSRASAPPQEDPPDNDDIPF